MGTKIVVGAFYRHNGRSSRNGWIGKLVQWDNFGQYNLLMSYTNGQQAHYSEDWFTENMVRVSNPDKFKFILWNPESNNAPRRTWDTFVAVKKVQGIMERKNHGAKFHIMQVCETEPKTDKLAMLDLSDIEMRVLGTVTGRWSACQEHFTSLYGRAAQTEVNLLTVGDKVIEITQEQATALLKDCNKNNTAFKVTKAIKQDDKYYGVSTIFVDS